MKRKGIAIDDPWVLSRASMFSKSFSGFVQTIVSEKLLRGLAKLNKLQTRIETAAKQDKLDEPGAPKWLDTLVSKIRAEVTEKALVPVATRMRDSGFLRDLPFNFFGRDIFSLSDALYEVAKERGIRHEGFLHLIKMLPEFEALMYFMNVKKFYRDHCAHQLRVAVLGDYLLELGSDSGEVEGVARDKLHLSSQEVRTAWWFAGLLHDTGFPLTRLSTAINWSILNEILRCYPSMDIEVSPMFLAFNGGELRNGEYLPILLDKMPSRWQELIKHGLGSSETSNKTSLFRAETDRKQEYQPARPDTDHGVAAAVNLLRTIGSPEKLKKEATEDRPLIEAARAIALHNFKGELGEIAFDDSPLAFLLILADELQEWSRPVPVPVKDTYFTTSLQKVTLLDEIFHHEENDLWDIPYTNREAKRIANFDFKKLCSDKVTALSALDCAEQFPESQIRLRDVKSEKPLKQEKMSIDLKTK